MALQEGRTKSAGGVSAVALSAEVSESVEVPRKGATVYGFTEYLAPFLKKWPIA